MSKKLVINTAWCKGCGICAAFCPRGHLKIVKEKVSPVEGTDCVLCGACELRCPDYAIYIEEINEAADNKTDAGGNTAANGCAAGEPGQTAGNKKETED